MNRIDTLEHSLHMWRELYQEGIVVVILPPPDSLTYNYMAIYNRMCKYPKQVIFTYHTFQKYPEKIKGIVPDFLCVPHELFLWSTNLFLRVYSVMFNAQENSQAIFIY